MAHLTIRYVYLLLQLSLLPYSLQPVTSFEHLPGETMKPSKYLVPRWF